MCGITGIYAFDEKYAVPKALIEKMTDTMFHRGPDEFGFYVDENVGLGHRRLCIIDLKTGKQPMSDKNDNICIVFNGEIYNFRELRKDLEGAGYTFKTQSDTEVIIYAYEEYGIDCLEKFNGMFAFAIYDKRKKRLFLARDRLGIKPLYYTITDKEIIFASEIKAILKHPNVKKKVNLYGISSYLSYRYVLGNETLFEDIYTLQPGYFLVCENGNIDEKQYWELPINPQKVDKGEEYYVQKLRELLTKSVKRRMISDVPLGAYLSGGLDSSIIVALMSEISDEPVKTFSVGFEEEGFNEFEYADLMAERYKTNHKEILLNAEKYMELMPTLIRYKDAPLSVANEVPLYEMSKELKKDITVVLSGEGADELFGGYGRIFRSPFDYERLKLIEGNPDLLDETVKNILMNSLRDKYGDLKFEDELIHFLSTYNWITLEEKKGIFTDEVNSIIGDDDHVLSVFKKYFDIVKELDHYDKYLWIFEKLHLVGLLMRVDMMTMAASVEARVPFVDHELVEFAFSLPFKYKIRWKSLLHQSMATVYNSDKISENFDTTKYLLREVFKDKIPEEVLYREKMGFPVPVHQWFGGKLNVYAKEILLDEKVKKRGIFNTGRIEEWLSHTDNFKSHQFGLKIWMLINLELWFREYFDEEGDEWVIDDLRRD